MTDYALITGASRGIGSAFARQLAAEKHALILVARSQHDLTALKDELAAQHGVAVHTITADLASPGTCRLIHEQCHQQGWHVSMLINNAGFGRFGAFDTHDLEDYTSMVQVNVSAPMELSHLFMEDLKRTHAGGIINVASTAAFQPTPYLAVYGASKAFLLSFSTALAAETTDTRIRVLALCPGATRTDFFDAAQMKQGSMFQSVPMSSPETVVRCALNALKSGRPIEIPGWKNRLMACITGLLPRTLTLNLSAKLMKRWLG